jgi:hypothetical protein
MKRIAPIFLWLIALALVWPVFKPLLKQEDSPAAVLGQLPVLEGGRVKPLDSVARSTLLLFHGKQSLRTEEGKVSAMEWFTDVLLDREAASQLPVFRIDHPNIVGMLGFEAGTRKYFSYSELQPYLIQIQSQARSINPDSKERNPYEKAINQLFGTLIQYQMLTQTVYPLSMNEDIPTYYAALTDSMVQRARLMQSGGAMGQNMTSPAVMRHMRQLEDMVQSPLFLLNVDGDWLNPGQIFMERVGQTGSLPPALEALAALAEARQQGNADAFSADTEALMGYAPESVDANPHTEFYFNQSQPFIVSLTLYVFVVLLVSSAGSFRPGCFSLQPTEFF